jgi:transcriptional regulator with XRE-family HTH domain
MSINTATPLFESEDVPADLRAVRWLLQMSADERRSWCAALAECSDDVRDTVMRLIETAEDPKATEREKKRAAATIREVLKFRHPHGTDLGQWEVDECLHGPQANQTAARLDSQEAAFAEKLRELLKSKGLTQAELAARVGCSQPAISQMLNRTCRPQRQTILKLATALDVHPRELWPDLDVADILDTVAEAQREQAMTDAEADAFRRALDRPAAQASANPLPKRKR